jgi:four helix bundle protein
MIETEKPNPSMFNFEKLDVWQKAIDLADLVYRHTRNFPADERFGLTNQMRRAAVSISSNIAEGTSRMSQTDFGRFIEIATGSVFEVISQAFIGHRLGLLNDAKFRALYIAAEEVAAYLADSEGRCPPNNIMSVSACLSTINNQL